MGQVIAVSGWKGSGKDTVAKYLIERHGAERVAFADQLKSIVSKYFDVPMESLEEDNLKENPLFKMPVRSADAFAMHINNYLAEEFRMKSGERPDKIGLDLNGVDQYVEKCVELFWTPRALCILVGSMFRAIDPNFWIKLAVKSIDDSDLTVVSDLRYRNEVHALKKAYPNLITLRINRFDKAASNHPSERDLDSFEFDHVISNRGTVNELHQEVETCLRSILLWT